MNSSTCFCYDLLYPVTSWFLIVIDIVMISAGPKETLTTQGQFKHFNECYNNGKELEELLMGTRLKRVPECR